VDLTESHFQASAPHLDIWTVRSAREALQRLTDTSIHLVMADLRLPDMSALELLREARHAGVPAAFIVITGKGDEQTAVAALKLGALDYIVKRDDYLTQLPFVVENAIARSELAASHARLEAELAERERLAAENAELLEGLHQALRARDEFLAIAAHEIRGPRTALRLAVQALEKGKLPAEVLPSRFEIIAREDHKLAEFVDELLDLGRIRAGTLSFLFVRVDLAAVVSDVVSRSAGDLRRSGSSVSVTSSGSLVGEWDRSRVEQVVGNLLSNAIKFGLGRPIEIDMDADDTHVRLRVIDHGVGIPSEARHRIFELFEREQSVRNYGGMGLGLYIVQTIVNRLHGTLAVESAHGVGSTFTVSLPKVRHA
jgi:signal transduction histidine kinase